MSNEPTPFPTYAEPPRQRGCFFYGCLTCVVLFVLGVGGIATLLYITYSKTAQLLLANADDAPMELPRNPIKPEEREQLTARIKAFKEGIESGKTPEPLVLNSDELNALLADSEDETFAKRLRVDIVGDRVEGRLSLPLEALDLFGMFGMKGKYLNAKGIFSISIQAGTLVVLMTEAEVKGKPVPESFMQSLSRDNLAKNAYNNSDNAAILHGIESVVVKDGKITIKARGPKPDASAEKEEPKAKEEAKPEAKDEAKSKEEPKAKDEARAKPKEEAKSEAKPKEEPKHKDEAKPKG